MIICLRGVDFILLSHLFLIKNKPQIVPQSKTYSLFVSLFLDFAIT